MKNWKQVPSDPLIASYIDCYWLIEKKPEDVGFDYPKLNPDPSAHLILAPPHQSYRYQLNKVNITGLGCHMILPSTSTIMLDHSQPFLILGIKFKVGALYSLEFKGELPLTNVIVNHTDFIPPEFKQLNHPAFFSKAADQIELTCASLDEQLLPWVKRNHEDKHSKLVRQAISVFDQIAISEMGNALYCSQRTIERAFRRVTGLTLKQYESMTRLESLLAFLYQHQDSTFTWADIAAQFGFSDQPHLIRYLKETIGTTPRDYLKHRDVTIDVYGDFE